MTYFLYYIHLDLVTSALWSALMTLSINCILEVQCIDTFILLRNSRK